MSFDRNAFKASKISSYHEEKQRVDTFKITQKGQYGINHTIDLGLNRFRILPPHKPGGSAWKFKTMYWLPCLKEEKDQGGNKTGKIVRSQYPIPDARVHGILKRDLVDEFIKAAKRIVWGGSGDKDTKRKLLSPITGYKDKIGKWHPGILPSLSVVSYAIKGNMVPENIGLLEIYPIDKEKLDNLIFDENEENIGVDPFTDPDEGTYFSIESRVNYDGKKERIFRKEEFNPKGLPKEKLAAALEKWRSSQLVSDEVLEKLNSMESLDSRFSNIYNKQIYLKAREALEFLEKEMLQFSVFEDPDFIKTIEIIESEPCESSDLGCVDEDSKLPWDKSDYEPSSVKGVDEKIELMGGDSNTLSLREKAALRLKNRA